MLYSKRRCIRTHQEIKHNLPTGCTQTQRRLTTIPAQNERVLDEDSPLTSHRYNRMDTVYGVASHLFVTSQDSVSKADENDEPTRRLEENSCSKTPVCREFRRWSDRGDPYRTIWKDCRIHLLPHSSIAVGSLLGRRDGSFPLENVCTTLVSTDHIRHRQLRAMSEYNQCSFSDR